MKSDKKERLGFVGFLGGLGAWVFSFGTYLSLAKQTKMEILRTNEGIEQERQEYVQKVVDQNMQSIQPILDEYNITWEQYQVIADEASKNPDLLSGAFDKVHEVAEPIVSQAVAKAAEVLPFVSANFGTSEYITLGVGAAGAIVAAVSYVFLIGDVAELD